MKAAPMSSNREPNQGIPRLATLCKLRTAATAAATRKRIPIRRMGDVINLVSSSVFRKNNHELLGGEIPQNGMSQTSLHKNEIMERVAISEPRAVATGSQPEGL